MSSCPLVDLDPGFTGFKALPDDHAFPIDQLLRGRREFFPQGVYIGSTLMKDVTAERRLLYFDRKEFRENRRLGFYFFVVTCILDVIVCSI